MCFEGGSLFSHQRVVILFYRLPNMAKNNSDYRRVSEMLKISVTAVTALQNKLYHIHVYL
jgi:hypothetical protein